MNSRFCFLFPLLDSHEIQMINLYYFLLHFIELSHVFAILETAWKKQYCFFIKV